MIPVSDCPDADCPVLDHDRLDVLRDVEGEDGRPFLYGFVELFEADTEERLAQLRAVATEGDVHRLRTMAHTLKGSCRNVGAVAMAQACLRLEHADPSCGADEAAAWVAAIGEEFERLRARLPGILPTN